MNSKELVQALRRMAIETGSLVCVGCGHEHNCSIHGCAVVKAAADVLEAREEKWISVKNRLPEKQQRVIVRCKTVGTTVGWIMFDGWVTDLGDGGDTVTHWMPLPEPPEE